MPQDFFSIYDGKFVDRVIDNCPSIISEATLGRLGYTLNKQGVWVQGERPIDFIGKTEHLVDHFIHALRTAGEKFNPKRLRKLPPKRVAGGLKKFKDAAKYSDKQKEALYAANRQLFNDFGYTP